MKRIVFHPRHTGDVGPNPYEVHPSCVGLGEAAAPRYTPRPSLFADARRTAILDRLEAHDRDGSTPWSPPALLGSLGS